MIQLSMRVGLTLALMLSYLLQAGSATSILAPAQVASVSLTQPPSFISDGMSPKMAASPALTSTVYLPLVSGPAFSVRPPNPLELTMSMDSSRATTTTLPLAGGTLTTTSATLSRAGGTLAATAGGASFQLTIPPDALLYTTTVVMTPISTVIGLSPTVQFIAGVHLEPEGLRLFNLATLTVTPSIAVPITQQVAFSSHAMGQSAYLYPLQRGTSQIVFKLMHFSVDAIGQSDGGPIPVQFDPNHVPVLAEDQYLQEVAGLVNEQRAAEQSGQPGRPDYEQRLELLNRGYYQNVLLGKLNQALGDCQNMRELIMPAIGWSRQVQLLFGASNNPFDAETANVMSTSLQALQNCWNKLKCVHWNIKSEVERVLSMARQLQLMTGSDQYDPFSLPECPCDQITSQQNWSGKVSWSYSRSVSNDDSDITVRRSGDVAAQLPACCLQANPTGSAHDYERYLSKLPPYNPPHIIQGGPLLPQQSLMILTLDPNKCTYNFWVNASVTDTDELGITTDGDAGSMQSEDKPLSNYDTALGGSGEFPAHSSVYQMQPYNGRDSFKAQEIVLIAGENGGGIAYVTWSFTPGP